METCKKKNFKFYDSYILKVLKTIGSIGITMDCRNQINSCLMHFSKHVSNLAFDFIVANGKKTLSHEEVSNALSVTFVCNDKLFLNKLLTECNLALDKFKQSEKFVSRQTKAGILFAPSVAEKFLRNFDYNKIMISAGAPIYLATALEFITMNILFNGTQSLQSNKRKRLNIKDVDKGIQSNPVLAKLLRTINFTFIEGACVEFIHPNLLMKTPQYTKKSKTNPKTKYKPGALSLKNIKRSQKDGMTLVVPKYTFENLVRQINGLLFPDKHIKISKDVFTVLQHYIELYLVKCLYDVNDVSIHCNRVKVLPSDIDLVMKLKHIDCDSHSDILLQLSNATEDEDVKEPIVFQ